MGGSNVEGFCIYICVSISAICASVHLQRGQPRSPWYRLFSAIMRPFDMLRFVLMGPEGLEQAGGPAEERG